MSFCLYSYLYFANLSLACFFSQSVCSSPSNLSKRLCNARLILVESRKYLFIRSTARFGPDPKENFLLTTFWLDITTIFTDDNSFHKFNLNKIRFQNKMSLNASSLYMQIHLWCQGIQIWYSVRISPQWSCRTLYRMLKHKYKWRISRISMRKYLIWPLKWKLWIL